MNGEFNGRPDNSRGVRIEPSNMKDIQHFIAVFVDTDAVRKEARKVNGKKKDKYILDMSVLPAIKSSDEQSRAFLKWIKGLGTRVSVLEKPPGVVDAPEEEIDAPEVIDDEGKSDEDDERAEAERVEALLSKIEASEAKNAELRAELNEANTRAAAKPQVVYVNTPNPIRQKEAEELRLQNDKLQTLLARLEQKLEKPAIERSRLGEPVVGIPRFQQTAQRYPAYDGQGESAPRLVRNEDQVGGFAQGPRDVEPRYHQEGSGSGLSFFKKVQLSVEEGIRALVNRPVQTATFKRSPEKRN